MAPAAALPAVVYEREPGAAARPLPPGYRRREPEKTVLYGVVRGHLETFLAEARAQSPSGAGYPAFVEKELRLYLSCGQLPHAFARLRCPQCGKERLVPGSCKGRLCPSCWGRRMADTAAHLVDRVLPAVPYRQWVLSFPWPLRLPLARDATFLSAALGTFRRTLFAWQRRRGRAQGIADGHPGAITFLQRFGSALNVHPHFHTIAADGLFVGDPAAGQPLEFVALPPPSDDDVAFLATRLALRLAALDERRRAALLDDLPPDDDEQAHLHAALEQAAWVPRDALAPSLPADAVRKPLCARVDGLDLHAERAVPADDRAGLESLCRYGLRAPFAIDRFFRVPDGRVGYRLPKPWPNPQGRTELHLEPHALLRRLVALLPPPYFNLVRYAGVFANRSRYRCCLPPPPPPPGEPPPEPAADPPPVRPRRLPWAQLLRRTFNADSLKCLACGVPMVVLAFLTDPAVVSKILAHLGLPTSPPPLAPARIPAQEELFPDPAVDDLSQDPDDHRRPAPPRPRGPP